MTMPKKTDARLTKAILTLVCHSLEKHHLPRILLCLGKLPEKDVWWRPHRSTNSVGNLVLHLNGNVRQWIVSGLGGQSFRRDRDREFREPGPLPRRKLTATLQTTVRTACQIIRRLEPEDLKQRYAIQGFRVPGLQAILHVSEHFALHTGQIIYITKLKLGKDLAFTRLPGERKRRSHAKLPVL